MHIVGTIVQQLAEVRNKWINDLNMHPETIQPLYENTESIIQDAGIGKDFIKKPKATVNRWEYSQLRTFCTAKETFNKGKKQPVEWEKNICTLHNKQGTNTQDLQNVSETQ